MIIDQLGFLDAAMFEGFDDYVASEKTYELPLVAFDYTIVKLISYKYDIRKPDRKYALLMPLSDAIDDSATIRSPFAYLAKRDKNEFLIVIRGTREPIDWITNLTYAPSPVYGVNENGELSRSRVIGRAHGMFAFYAQQLATLIFPMLQKCEKKELNVVIAGHSLGGAVAQILALQLKDYIVCSDASPSERPQIKIRVYTWGAPAVFVDDDVAGFVSETEVTEHHQTYRLDIVPMLPPESVVLPNCENNSGIQVVSYRATQPTLVIQDAWLEAINPAYVKPYSKVFDYTITGLALNIMSLIVPRQMQFVKNHTCAYWCGNLNAVVSDRECLRGFCDQCYGLNDNMSMD